MRTTRSDSDVDDEGSPARSELSRNRSATKARPSCPTLPHANAALTPRARLPAARAPDRRPRLLPAGCAAERWPTCRGAPRRRGPELPQVTRAHVGTARPVPARSPHHQPNRTPAPVVRKIVHLRWKQRLGPVEIADRLGMAASTVHAVLVRCRINRLTHIDRATGEPIRRYEHEAPGDLIHVDVKSLGRVPDGGGWRYDRPQTGQSEPGRDTRPTPQQVAQPADRDLLRAHRHRRPLPCRLRRGPRR